MNERGRDGILRELLSASHVFVYASFPFISVYAANLATFPMGAHMVVRPTVVVCVATIVLLVALRVQTRSLQHRAVELSLFLIGLLSFILTSTLAGGYWLRSGKPDWVLSAIHVVVGVLLASYARRADRAIRIAPLLRAIAAALLFVMLGQIALASARGETWHPAVEAIGADAHFRIPVDGPRPDIVHLLLDGFGSPQVVKTYYGLDLGRQIAALEARQFTVARDARSNYAYTYSSVPSFLNATYLDPLGILAGTTDRRPLRYLIDHASVITTLKRAGYRFTFIGSSYSATDRHPLADRCDCAQIGMNELETAVYRFSPFRVFRMDWLTYEPFRRKIHYEFDAIRNLEAEGPPQYALAHLILPHPPYAFDERGQLPAGPRPIFGMPDGDEFPGTREEYETGYRAQVQFALDQIIGIVADLQQRRRPTVIIVSGDHGPGSRLRRDDWRQSDLRERFNIFLAVHVPGRPIVLPSEMTLVNLYREVLRQSLDAQVDDALPNRTIFTAFSTPYRFEEVSVPAW